MGRWVSLMTRDILTDAERDHLLYKVPAPPAGVLTPDQMLAHLHNQVKTVGSVNAWCKRAGYKNRHYLSLVLAGSVPVTPQLARACGYERRQAVEFVPIQQTVKGDAVAR